MVAANEWKFNQLFTRANRYTFEIPKYQRGYSWDIHNIDEFLEDLISTNDKEDHYHFFGTIYTSERDNSYQIRIVDGQQRITTAAIFLICVRDYFYGLKENEEANRCFGDMQGILYKLDNQLHKPDLRRFYLILSRTNKDFFTNKLIPPKIIHEQSKIKESASNDSNEFLAEAYLKLSKFITEYGKDHGIGGVNNLVWTLLNRFELIKVNVRGDDQAYEMFNLINNRGTKLAESDLIKNRLFAKLDQEFSSDSDSESFLDEYDQKWADLRDNITGKGDYNMDNFFHHYLIAFEFENLKLKQIFDKIRELKKKPDQIIDELLLWSEIFVKLRNPRGNFERYALAEHYLEKIKNIKAMYVYPVLLSGYKNYWEKNDKKSFAVLCEICLKYHLRTKSVGIGITLENYQVKLHKVASMINDKTATINEVIDELIRNDNAYPSTDKITPQLETLKVTNSNLAITLLEELELVHDKEKFGGPDVSVEHIMPKNPKYWLDYIMRTHNYANKDDAKTMHAKYCNWLGNQTLFSDSKNRRSSNKPFEDKKKIYKRDGYKITSLLADKPKWTENEIISRQHDFVDDLIASLDLTQYKI